MIVTREFSVLFLAVGGIWLICHDVSAADGTSPDERPNIVLIMADDMGYGDVQVLNASSKVPTPNLNRLAAEGMTFTDAHTPSSVCTPTRYGLLTGRPPWGSTTSTGSNATRCRERG